MNFFTGDPEDTLEVLSVLLGVTQDHIGEPTGERIEPANDSGREAAGAHDFSVIDKRVEEGDAGIEHQRRAPSPVQDIGGEEVDMAHVTNVQNIAASGSPESNADGNQAQHVAADQQHPSPREEPCLVPVVRPEIKMAIDDLDARFFKSLEENPAAVEAFIKASEGAHAHEGSSL